MADGEVHEDDIITQIDWDSLFNDIPIDVNLFADDLPLFTESVIGDSVQETSNLSSDSVSSNIILADINSFAGDLPVTESSVGNSVLEGSNPSPDSGFSWVDELEQLLMNDDIEAEGNQEINEDFFSDLLDESSGGSEEVRASSEEFLNPESIVSDDSDEKDKLNVPEANKGEEYDPMSKKRKRQLRNRDAAMRSRERKKSYVRDLELKSKYFEGECRRLERLLQCSYAENQALHLRLQKDKDFGASRAKQESAVLLLEPLLLGSLFWFLGIMCLFSLPRLLSRTPAAVALENAGSNFPENPCLGGTANERLWYGVFGRMFLKSKRCKASRTKMKLNSLFTSVLV